MCHRKKMKSLIQFPPSFFILALICNQFGNSEWVNNDYDVGGSIAQVSRFSKISDVRMLKATLVPSKTKHQGIRNRLKIKVNAWLDSKGEHETFLLIDEVYDARVRMSFPLKNPYLIQVSTSERTLTYPLILNTTVDVTCDEGEKLRRRKADNEALTDEGLRVYFYI